MLNAFKPDGTPAHDIVRFRYYTGKLSYQATSSNRFIGFYTQSHKPEDGETSDEVAYESRKQQDLFQMFGKGEWQGVRGNSLIANLQTGFIRRARNVYADTTNIRRLDVERVGVEPADDDDGGVDHRGAAGEHRRRPVGRDVSVRPVLHHHDATATRA